MDGVIEANAPSNPHTASAKTLSYRKGPASLRPHQSVDLDKYTSPVIKIAEETSSRAGRPRVFGGQSKYVSNNMVGSSEDYLRQLGKYEYAASKFMHDKRAMNSVKKVRSEVNLMTTPSATSPTVERPAALHALKERSPPSARRGSGQLVSQQRSEKTKLAKNMSVLDMKTGKPLPLAPHDGGSALDSRSQASAVRSRGFKKPASIKTKANNTSALAAQ